jgi:hypothetical protein
MVYLYFSGEGLAVKYCNNAERVLSKSIYSGCKNIGLYSFSWKYLNDDFCNNKVNMFKKNPNVSVVFVGETKVPEVYSHLTMN